MKMRKPFTDTRKKTISANVEVPSDAIKPGEAKAGSWAALFTKMTPGQSVELEDDELRLAQAGARNYMKRHPSTSLVIAYAGGSWRLWKER